VTALRRPRLPFGIFRPRLRIAVISLGLAVGAGIVIWSPLLIYRLLGESLPWVSLANVGEAYGGASALLSAAALSGIGASLFLQTRQMRQEVMSLDKQRHFELIKLALENPEFFEIIDGSPLDAHDGKRKIYANLTLTYWLAMWELGEIGDRELRTLTSNMFRSSVSRDWWNQVNGYWITVRGRRRRQFIQIVHQEWASANAQAESAMDNAAAPSTKKHRAAPIWYAAASAVAAGLVAAHLHGRRSSRNR
jgi:hypothetical protein